MAWFLQKREELENQKAITRISSKWGSNVGNQYWQTPAYLFDALKKHFDFKLDAAANPTNNLGTELYYTEKENGLSLPWKTWTFCNPPYSETGLWVRKAYWEQRISGIGSVLLLPANTDTKWFHDYIWNRFDDISKESIYVKFIKKRVKYIGAKDPAKYSNMVIIFADNLYRNRYINLEPPMFIP